MGNAGLNYYDRQAAEMENMEALRALAELGGLPRSTPELEAEPPEAELDI